ncbi:MAG: DUF1573 domain-containing protein [Bacteroidales bacterium]|nr:DUF1573 domain-containing protein [Bacteroidales bacterium]
MHNATNCLFFLLIITLIFSCHREKTIITFSAAEELSKKSFEPIFLSIIDGSEEAFIAALSNRNSKYICDLSIAQNYVIRRILEPQKYPFCMELCSGQVISIEGKSAEEIEYFNNLLTVYEKIQSTDPDTLNWCYENLKQLAVSNRIYPRILLTIACKLTGRSDEFNNRCKDLRREKRIMLDPLFFSLMSDLSLDDGTLTHGPKMVLDTSIIDVGVVMAGEKITRRIRIHNVGDETLVFFQPIVSCSCLRVSAPRTIIPGKNADCIIEMKTAGITGMFNKEAFLVSNASNGAQKLIIKGEILFK